MKEDFLHFLWKHQKFSPSTLVSSQGELITVIRPGIHNQNDGPDFLQAEIRIGELHWAGSVELHLKSSDWYRHQHQLDKAYDAVVLHVVWEDDIEVCLANGSLLPTLALSNYVSQNEVNKLHHYFKQHQSFIPCEDQFPTVSTEILTLWKERLYIERLEQKANRIQAVLKDTKNDWEAVLFVLLAQNFGLNTNGASFFAVAQSIPFTVVRKTREDVQNLEALFLGQAGLISSKTPTSYAALLWERFTFLQRKYSLPAPPQLPFYFSRLRPHNFPTIRWVQLAQLYASSAQLFSRFFSPDGLQTAWLKKSGVSVFWETHFTFNKESKQRQKNLSDSFVELLKINTLIPLYFCYERTMGNDPSEKTIEWIRTVKKEKNSLVNGFASLGAKVDSALDSQALIQLKKNYCDTKKCLLCAVGVHLINHPSDD